ncbi:MAG: cytochrome c biogenesis protein ResB, partial [Actinomycetota bacterium]|nr:cytochrome c biogenesis protein ResB [Actinomycetota bacterium]
LMLSTGACAWERTRRVWLRTRRDVASTKRVADRLRDKPTFVIPVEKLGASDVASAFKSLRMRTTPGDEITEARSGRLGTLGSPIFHWSLVLLFLFVGLGQLTRSEGLMGVVSGSSKPDVEASYGVLTTGPLHGAMSGRLIAVTGIERSFSANGLTQGPTPFIELRDADGTLLKADYAYSNHPLRYRSTFIHMNADGLAAVVSVGSAGSMGQSEVLIDYAAESPTGVQPTMVAFSNAQGVPIADVVFDLPPSAENTVAVAVRYAPVGGLTGPDAREVVLTPGGSVALSGDVVLRIDRLTSYARLSVVDDWSVAYIYISFGLALLGLMLALFVSPRTLWVTRVETESGAALHVLVRHARGDAAFPTRTENAFRASVDSEGA